MWKRLERLVSMALIAALTLQPVFLHAQNIQIVGPDNGPRPHLDRSYNGTAVLNIDTPNAAGVSHDIYTDFTANDLILNNSATNVTTQMGGWIEGNPNLVPGQAADLWIGEVVGGNQTQLNGILEVGGQSMDVVLANEFGITCNGCGFVNTGRATLTTGTPRFGAGGALSGFDVTQGRVTIGAGGLNPEGRLSRTDTSRVDVIARAAAIYGAMRADQINLVAGANIVDYNWSYDPETGAVTGITEQAGTGTAPALAVDVAALGGMYANAIQMVATENGVGVRLDGEMASSTNIALRADGRLTLGAPADGHVPQIKAREKVIIRNQGPLLLEGSVISETGNLIDIRTSEGSLTFTGQADGGAITLDAAGLANITAAITASDTLRIASRTAAVTLGGGAEISGAAIDMSARTDVTLTGKATATGTLTATAGTTLTTDTTAELSATDIALAGQSIQSAGSATAGQALSLDAGPDGARNSGSLSGRDVTLTSAGDLRNSGKISASEQARLSAAAALASGASSETFGREVTLSAASATLDGVIKADDALDVITRDGDLQVNGTLTGGTTVLSSAAKLTQEGAVAGTRSALLTAAETLRTGAGSEISGGDVALTAPTILTDGNVLASATLALTAGSGGITQNGVLVGQETRLTSEASIATRGTITGRQSATLTAATTLAALAGSALYGDAIALQGASVITDGVVNAGQSLAIQAGLGGTSNSGSLSAATTTITSEGRIDNTGILSATDTLTLETASVLTNAATLISGDDLAIHADQILNNGGVIWANDSITLAATAALDPASLVQNTNGRIEAFQGDLIIRADEVANLGTAPTIGESVILKWLDQGQDEPFAPATEIATLIDPAYLDGAGRVLPAYAAQYTALFADLINGAGLLSPAAQSLLRDDVTTPSGTALRRELAGRWGALTAKANAAGVIDPAADVLSHVDPAIFDAEGIVLPEHAAAYAAYWEVLATGGTTVPDAVKPILAPSALVVESTTTDPATGAVTTTYTNELTAEVTDLWAEMTLGSNATYDIVNILYQDRFNQDGTLAELVAGGNVDIAADEIRNIFGNISAGEDLFLTANTVTNQAMGASQVLLEVHKKPGCFTCHEGEVDFYDTFGGRIEAVGAVSIMGSLTNVTLNSSELTLQDVMDEMNAYIAEQQAAGDADLTAVPLVARNNFHLEEHRSDDFTAPVEGNGTDIRDVAAADTGASTSVDTGAGTPTILPLDPGRYSTSVETVTSVTPALTPTAPLDALLAAGLNTIAETDPEFTAYANYITSNYMMDVDRLQYRDELVNNTSETILAALAKADIIADAGALDYLNQPISLPAADGSGLTTIYPAATNFALDSTGALIRGNSVTITGDAIDNSGTIHAALDLSITANTITGTGGALLSDAGQVALTALGRIAFDDVAIDGASVDIIAGQDFIGRGVSISSATDTSIYAVTGVTLTALENAYEFNRNQVSVNPLTGATQKTSIGTVTARDQKLSSLNVGGDLSIISSADLALAGVAGEIGGDTLLSAAGDLLLTAVEAEYQYTAGNAKNGTDLHTITSYVTDLSTGGDFTATAGGQALLVGTQIDAGGAVQLAAAEDVVLAAAQDIYSFETRRSKKSGLFGFKKKSSSYSITEITNQGAKIAASGDIDVIAESGDLITAGSAFVSNSGDINLSAVEGDIYAGSYTDVFQEEKKKSSSLFWGLLGSSSQRSTIDEINTGTEALATLDLALVSGADTTLVGATLSAGRNLTIDTGGDFSVQAAIDSQRSDYFSSNMGLVTMTTIQERSFVETAVFTQLLAGQSLSLGIGGQAELALYTQAGVDAPSPGDLYPQELLALNGLELLSEDLANDYFYDEKVQLSPAFKALAAIALSVYAPGLGSNLFGALGATTTAAGGLTALGSAGAAFTSSALIGTLDGIVGGNLDIGEILQGASFSALGAGLTAGINLDDVLGAIPENSTLNQALLGEFGHGSLTTANLLEGALDGAINSGLGAAVYGTDFLDGFSGALAATVVNLALADAQFEIGELGGGSAQWEGSTGHALLHGLAGCAAAQAQGADCAAGAAAGIAQSLYAGRLNGASLTDEQQQQRAELIGAAVGYIFSGGNPDNVSIASTVALSGIANNRQLHRDEADWAKEHAAEFAEVAGVSLEEAEAMLLLELNRRVNDDFASAEPNALAERFIVAKSPTGLVVDGQHLFANLRLQATEEYFNSTINIYRWGEIYSELAQIDAFDLTQGYASFTGVDGISNDLFSFSGLTDRSELLGFIVANREISEQLGAEAAVLLEQVRNGTVPSDLVAETNDLIEDLEGLSTGFANANRKAVVTGRAEGLISLSEIWFGNGTPAGAAVSAAFADILAAAAAANGLVIRTSPGGVSVAKATTKSPATPYRDATDSSASSSVGTSGTGSAAANPGAGQSLDNAPNTGATIGGKTCVYSCVVNGTTRYVGITDDILKRGQAHLRQKGIVIDQIPGMSKLSRADARAVEQTLINYHGLGKNGGTLINKINSISAVNNPTKYEQALVRGAELLKQHKYPGF
ncbi:filamentous hemagglutinin N-terminal domain-containing protein [Roseovarius sp.]|uniref:two-partner secretion domain-containing protein n=1 Tax=Roseovarius sp. TaxID=1486281 RepID=UPI00257DAB39|nr:filamentous hemagglutinin N-terminal domain-containing protein [Roseovarius sp.]